MKELRKLSKNIAIDTGPLLLPLTREAGWESVKKILYMHERGELTLHVGLFNIGELASATYKLGFDAETALSYAKLVSEKLSVVEGTSYAMWLGMLRIESYRSKYNIPWGDISSASAALSMNIPVIVLGKDDHFKLLAKLCSNLGKTIRVIKVEDLQNLL